MPAFSGCSLGYLANTARTVDFQQKFLKSINVYAAPQHPPWGYARIAPARASPRQCSPVVTRATPALRRAQPAGTGSKPLWLPRFDAICRGLSGNLMGHIRCSDNRCTATALSQHSTSDKQHLWGSRPQPARCRVYWWDSSWLNGYAYSTLPVKGEESLVSFTASSAQNLDSRISSSLPDQPDDDDQRRGFLP